MDNIAMYFGYGIMFAGGGLLVLALIGFIYFFIGLTLNPLAKRLKRFYHFAVLRHWLSKLENEGIIRYGSLKKQIETYGNDQ